MTLLTLDVPRCTKGTYDSPSRVRSTVTGVALTEEYGPKETMPSQCPD